MIRIFCVFSFLFVSRLCAVEISTEAKKYFSNPEYSNVSISPSGRYLSYISPDPNLSLFVYDFDTGKVRSIAGRASSDDRNESMTFRAHKQDIVNPIWISDQYLIYEVVERDIESNGWFYSDADLTFSRRIGSAGYSSLLDRLPNDPSKFLVIDDEKESDKHFFPDVFLVDVKKTKRKLVVKNPGNIERWATDENGVVRLGVIDQGANYEFIYRVAEKSSWQKLDTPDSSRFLAMLDNGKLLLISAIIEGDTESLWIFNPIENKLVSKVSSDPEYDLISDVSRLLRSQDSNNLVGLLYHKDKPEIKWFNPTYKQFAEVINKLLPNTTNRIIGFNPKQRLVLAECWSDKEPGFVCSYNLDNNQISPLLKYRPNIDPEKEHSKIPIKFASRDGQNIHGYVSIPRGQKGPHPLIVYSRGGPFTRDTFDWDPVVQFFSAAGYAVLQVNYRGSEGYGSHYCPKKIAEFAKISVNDVIDGINYLLQKGVADKKRVGFYGASFGGYITGGLASSGLDYGKCAASFAGVFDWIKQFKDWESDDPIWYEKNKHLYGDYTQQVEELNAVSPLFKADEVSIPFYLVHGKSDGRVSITQTKRYADALRQQEVSVKEEYYSWAIHGLPNETRRIEYFIELLKFFEEHLE